MTGRWMRWIPILVAALLSVATLSACRTEAKFPSKAITMVVLVAAGGPMDTYGREAARIMEKVLNVPFAVENRTGGAGLVGLAYARSQPADGHTVVGVTASLPFALALPDAGIKAEELEWVIRQIAEPIGFYVRKDSPFTNLDELIQYARANPGKLKVSGSLSGGYPDRTLSMFSQLVGIKLSYVPFDGASQAMTALVGGNVDACWVTATGGLSMLQDGRIRGLGFSGEKRLDYLAEVPTFKEKGIDMVSLLWRGFAVAKGTPPEAVKTLHDGFKKMMDTPEWKDYVAKNRQVDAYLGTADFAKSAAKETEDARAYLKEIGVIK